jgi:uncharacterized protein YceH (UPF0502 family)
VNIEISALEARVLGCLLEKAVLTPDQYPLTLNALVNACNQKSSRDPVLSLDAGTVQRTARQLADKHLVTRHENFRSGVEKYEQRLCNTTFGELQLSAAEYAVLCLLLLRGPQTPGEIRARSGRLHEFADNEAARAVLQGLAERADRPLVARLPRAAGRQDSAWAHLLGGTVEAATDEDTPVAATRSPRGEDRLVELEARVVELERALAELTRQLGS